MKILINGEFVKREDATVDLFSDALMFGVGVFETLRTFHENSLFQLGPHVERLLISAKQINLSVAYPQADIEQMVHHLVQATPNTLQRVKILAIPEHLIVISTPFSPDETVYSGVTLKSILQKRSLPEIKSICYMDALLSYQQAQKAGFYDALLMDQDQEVYEGSRTNIFWFEGTVLKTRQHDVLPGITRDVIQQIAGTNFQFSNIKLDALKEASEVFITNSVVGILPVLKIDDAIIGEGTIGEHTTSLMEIYNRHVQKTAYHYKIY